MVPVVPTRVGVNRMSTFSSSPWSRCPHARGGEPGYARRHNVGRSGAAAEAGRVVFPCVAHGAFDEMGRGPTAARVVRGQALVETLQMHVHARPGKRPF